LTRRILTIIVEIAGLNTKTTLKISGLPKPNTMNNLHALDKPMRRLVFSTTLALFVAGCSDDKPKQQTSTNTVTTTSKPAPKDDHNPNPWDHSGEAPVSEAQKQQFEQQFADQCVKREMAHADNNAEAQQFSRACNCVAHFMAKTLTPQEAEKFLAEHENPHSLEIKYENAAYHCLQQKQPPHEPDFSRKP